MEEILNLKYALDTLYFLMMGAFVMWMAAGFSMLEAGLVRAKNTTEILTKNVALYSIACVMYMLVGYNLMYPGDAVNSFWPGITFLLGAENDPATVLSVTGDEWYSGSYYSGRSDFFFPGGLRRYRHVYCFRSCSRTDEAVAIPCFLCCSDWIHLPDSRFLEMGRWLPGCNGFL